MGLNHIKFPATLIADLYKNHLIEDGQQALFKGVADNTSLKKNIQYLGKNQKGVCLLVDYANEVHLPDNQLHFLTTILQACKLDLGDVAIINCHQQTISFAALREQFACNYLLIFGVDAVNIGLEEIASFTIKTLQSCHIVCSPATEQLNNTNPESKLLKSKLWICLKQLFGI